MNCNTTSFSPEVAAALGNILLHTQMGIPLTGANLNATKPSETPKAISIEEYNTLLEKPLWQMTGAQYKALTETTILNLVMTLQQKPQKHYAHGLAEFAKFIGKSVATAQRIKSSGVIDDAVTQKGNTIIIDTDLAMELIRKDEAANKKEKGGHIYG